MPMPTLTRFYLRILHKSTTPFDFVVLAFFNACVLVGMFALLTDM